MNNTYTFLPTSQAQYAKFSTLSFLAFLFFTFVAFNLNAQNSFAAANFYSDLDATFASVSPLPKKASAKSRSTTSPIVAFPSNSTIPCSAAPQFGTPQLGTKALNAAITFTDHVIEGDCPSNLTYVRNWSVVDIYGATHTGTQKITTIDNEAPVFMTSLEDKTVACGSTADFDAPKVSDACGGEVALTYVDEVLTNACSEGVQTVQRTWTAVDLCGNASTIQQSMRIKMENEKPDFTVLPTKLKMTAAEYATWEAPQPTLSSCSIYSLDHSISTVNECGEDIHTVRYVATDVCGNTNTHDLEVAVEQPILETELPNLIKYADLNMASEIVPVVLFERAPLSYNWSIEQQDDQANWKLTGGTTDASAKLVGNQGQATLTLTVVDANGCFSESQIALGSATTTDKNNEENQFNVTYEIGGQKSVDLTIIDAIGVQTKLTPSTVENGKATFVINTENLPTGDYQLVTKLNGGTKVQTFTK